MSNRQLIKTAHIWALTAIVACGLWVIAGKAGSRMQGQNSNQNSNSNSNANTANANRTQNDNANRSANRNTGMQAGMSSQDRKFVMDAAMGGMMEVELGRVAAQRGTSEAIKQFGQRMVDDHSGANTELMSLASSKGITLPTALDEKHQKEVTKLSGMSGAEFDRAYAKRMVKDHDKKLDTFEKQSTRGTDPDLKAFATKSLTTIREHLQMARALPGAEGGNDNRSGGNSNRGGNMNSNRNSNGNNNGNNNGNSNSNRP